MHTGLRGYRITCIFVLGTRHHGRSACWRSASSSCGCFDASERTTSHWCSWLNSSLSVDQHFLLIRQVNHARLRQAHLSIKGDQRMTAPYLLLRCLTTLSTILHHSLNQRGLHRLCARSSDARRDDKHARQMLSACGKPST